MVWTSLNRRLYGNVDGICILCYYSLQYAYVSDFSLLLNFILLSCKPNWTIAKGKQRKMTSLINNVKYNDKTNGSVN